MGSYVVANATSPADAATWASTHGAAFGSFERITEGVRYTEPSLSDAQTAEIFAGYVPNATMPAVVLEAGRIVHRVAYATNAELAAIPLDDLRVAVRALARAVIYLNSRLDVTS